MRLFGAQGYQATTIAQVEAAAGLSPGAGGLYRHFPSKRDLLDEGIRREIAAGDRLVAFIEDPATLTDSPLRDRLKAVARAGLRRLEEERDVNRLLLRDLAAFPDLLEEFRQAEIHRVFQILARWLSAQAGPEDHTDWQAVAAVLVGAVSHYWVLSDIFGRHPDGVAEDRYLTALAEMAASLLERPQ